MSCHCGSEGTFDTCCQPLLNGAVAPSAERLMRSRFVAYKLGDIEYVVRTTDPQTRLDIDRAAVETWMNDSEFEVLDVLNASEEGTKATVEFIARFKDAAGAAQAHHEVSRFRKQAGVWYFSRGKVRA